MLSKFLLIAINYKSFINNPNQSRLTQKKETKIFFKKSITVAMATI